ncbi:unnamed protein product, partial [Laminaria digitata]
GTYTVEEDEALRTIVDREGEGRWIAKARDLQEALEPFYKRLTDAAIAKGETPVAYGRIAAQCLHRWKKVLQPGVRKGHWTDDEDAVLVKAVGDSAVEGTPVKWSKIALLIPGRLGKQCRERWFNHLDPSLTKTVWTSREDEVLFNALAFFGPRWCEIEKLLPGRTANSIKNRSNSSAGQRWHQCNAGNTIDKRTSCLFMEKLKATL